MSSVFSFIQLSFGSSSLSNQRRKRKEIHIRKEKVRLSLFAGNMILYIGNPKDATRKLLELISEFNKFAGYKIDIQKSLAYLYASNELLEREIKETVPFTISSKRVQYLGTNLSKEIKYLYLENCKIPMKEIFSTNRWKNMSLNSRINVVKLTITTIMKAISIFSAIPVKIPMDFFTELE